MSQQINLLNPSLIRPRDWLSLKNMALIYSALVLAMLAYYKVLQQSQIAMQQQRDAAVAEYQRAQQEVQMATNVQADPASHAAREQEIQALTSKQQLQEKALLAFKQAQADQDHHVYNYLQGFARQVLADVWLTGFKVDAFTHQLSMTGSALSADRVPAFIEHLAKDPVFQGQQFGGLLIKSGKVGDARAASATTEALASPADSAGVTGVTLPGVAVVDFEIKAFNRSERSLEPAATTRLEVTP